MIWLGLVRGKIFCLKEPLDTWVECNNMLVNLFLGGWCEKIALWNVDGVATLLIGNHSTDYMSCFIMKSQSYQMRAMNAPLFRLTLPLPKSSYHLRNEKLYQGKIFTKKIKSYYVFSRSWFIHKNNWKAVQNYYYGIFYECCSSLRDATNRHRFNP